MKRKIGLMAVTAALVLSACASVPDMSKETNSTAAQYVADALLRNDKHYDEGIDYDHSLLKPTPTPEPTPAPVNPEKNKSSGENGKGTSEQPQTTSRKRVSMANIYGIKGVKVTPVSYQLKSSYGSSVYQIMPVRKGDKLVVVYFNVANKSGKKKRVNLAAKNVSAELIVNGKSVGGPMLSLADNDLQNLNVILDAGKTKQGVLLFEISKSAKVSSVEIHLATATKEASSAVK